MRVYGWESESVKEREERKERKVRKREMERAEREREKEEEGGYLRWRRYGLISKLY